MYDPCMIVNTDKHTLAAISLCSCYEEISSDIKLDWSVPHDEWSIVYFTITLFAAISGFFINLSLLVGVARTPSILQTHTLFVCGQGIVDFTVGTIAAAFSSGAIFLGRIIGGNEGCVFHSIGIAAACHATLFSLCVIAWSRKTRIIDGRTVRLGENIARYIVFVIFFPLALVVYYRRVTVTRLNCTGSFCNPIWNVEAMVMCSCIVILSIAYVIWVYHMIRKFLKTKLEAILNEPSSRISVDVYALPSQRRFFSIFSIMSINLICFWFPLLVYFSFRYYKLADNGNKEISKTYWILERCFGIALLIPSSSTPLIHAWSNRKLQLAMMYAFLPKKWKEERERKDKLIHSNKSHRSRSSFKVA